MFTIHRTVALILVLGVCIGTPAHAEHNIPSAATVDATAEHHPVAQHVFAAKSIVVVEKSDEESEVVAGPGVVYEHTLVPHALEIEGAVALLFGGGTSSMPLDLLLKVPFELTRVVDLYVGLGPAAKISLHPEANVHFGLLASVGSYFWIGRHWGLLAEVDYGYVAEAGGVHEIEAGAGAAFRVF